MSSINPFDYGDYHYNYTPQKLAEESKFNSFMQQSNASYFESTENVFNNKKLDKEKLQFDTFISNTEAPTPNVHIIKGYNGDTTKSRGGGPVVKILPPQPQDFGTNVLWADRPIMTENGDVLYFQWGSTEGHTLEEIYTQNLHQTQNTYKFYKNGQGWIKYNWGDRKTVLDEEDDAATAILGKPWRLPTYSELNSWYEKIGNRGDNKTYWMHYKKSDKYIYIVQYHSGFINDLTVNNNNSSCFWTSTRYGGRIDMAYCFGPYMYGLSHPTYKSRYCAMPIFAVQDKN